MTHFSMLLAVLLAFCEYIYIMLTTSLTLGVMKGQEEVNSLMCFYTNIGVILVLPWPLTCCAQKKKNQPKTWVVDKNI